MSNDYYTSSNAPATGSSLSSATMRAEFDAVETGMDKLIDLSTNANKVVKVNAGGTAQTASSITDDGTTVTLAAALSLSGDVTLTGAGKGIVFEGTTADAFETTLLAGEPTADRQITLPDATDTLVGKATTDTLTNKTINLASNTLVATSAQLATAVTDETGSGALVFGTSPTLSGPTITGSWTANGATCANGGTVTTIDINGGTVDGVTIGGASAGAGTFTTLTSTGNAALGDAEATDTHTIKGATTLSVNSASAALTINQVGAGNALVVEDSTTPDSTPFVIAADGRVLRGHTAAVTTRLGATTVTPLIQSFDNGNGAYFGAAYSADTTPAIAYFAKSRSATTGTVGSVVSSGDAIMRISCAADDGTQFTEAARIEVAVDGTPGTNDMPGRIVFSTTADGASTVTERYRIASDGKHTKTGYVQVDNSTNNAAFTITNTGSGNSFVVEDSASTDSTPFVIDASGNVVVGTTSPSTTSYSVYIESSSGLLTSFGSNTAAVSPTIGTSRRRTGLASVASGDSLGKFSGFGWDASSFIEAARIESFVDGTPGTNDMPGRLVFSTTADGASSVTERMRIDSAGGVGIGTTSLTGYNLNVSKNLTGATSAANVRSGTTVLSDVTTVAYGVLTEMATQATAFTLSAMYHYMASQATIGASSAVTTQAGFHSASNLIGATTNYGYLAANTAAVTAGKTAYGFYSSVNIATGGGTTYGFYAAGTATNYFGGLVDISGASAGQIKFPATQNASADANTLDDYEEGDWTPVITAATVGDLSVTYSTQYGRYTKVGRLVTVSYLVVTSAFTHTTASGLMRMSGLPFTPLVTNGHAAGGMRISGLTKATYTSFSSYISANDTSVYVACSGSGVTVANANITDFPTGGSVVISGQVSYVTA